MQQSWLVQSQLLEMTFRRQQQAALNIYEELPPCTPGALSVHCCLRGRGGVCKVQFAAHSNCS